MVMNIIGAEIFMEKTLLLPVHHHSSVDMQNSFDVPVVPEQKARRNGWL
jgi:hypothetical protein